jgi:hypothetical protein
MAQTTRQRTTTSKVVNVPSEPEFTNPEANPERANAEIAALLQEETPNPVIQLPPDDLVVLPGGLVRGERVIRSGIVRELTGKDEESLARASQSLNPFHFFDRLLSCGVVKLGDEATTNTEKILKDLLIGDREALILGIRKATYGDEIEIEKWTCAYCAHEASLSMQIGDIPVETMNDPATDTVFEVPMRKGGYAEVRLATGADQLAIFEKPELTQAQRESLFLSKCINFIKDSRGLEMTVQGFPSLVLDLSVPDRHAILKELGARQPGPKYDQIEYACESCGEKGTVNVGIGDLFLDFGWI